MTAPLDHFNPEQKRVYVVVGVTMGLVLAVSSTALRLWAKLISTKRLQAEDGFMVAALFCGIGTASCLYYGEFLPSRSKTYFFGGFPQRESDLILRFVDWPGPT